MKRFVPAIIVLIGLLASSGLCQESPKESTGPGPETAQDETDSRFVPPLINKKKGFGFGTDLHHMFNIFHADEWALFG